MIPSMRIDSLALFGSVARGDADLISDRDVLVATKLPEPLIADALERAGYSPSLYIWEQLQNLARDGSLFLQHLKQESRILLDRQGRLRDLLSDYRPRSDYSARITDNLKLLELTNGVPATPLAMAWAFDVLAVALRNHAILDLAQEGTYIFSYSELIMRLAFMHQLSYSELHLLLDLRCRKREYRSNPHFANTSLPTLLRTQAVIERITGANLLSLRLSAYEFVNQLLALPQHAVHWYFLLRRYEGVYRAMGFAPLSDSTPEQREIDILFAAPSPYTSTGSDSIAWIRTELEALYQNWMNEPTTERQGRRAA